MSLIVASAILFLGRAPVAADVLKPVPFTAVHLTDTFWAPKIEVNRAITIPFAFQKCEETGRMYNFERAAMALQGKPFKDHAAPGYPFDDTDVYKVLEGASYALAVKPDPKLDAYLDKLIVKIAAAQEPDGYLYTARTIDPAHPHAWSGKVRWVNEEDQSHELYDLGHLYEAAVAHYQATGKRSLLNVAIKSANLLVKTFGPGKRKIWPGHEIVEMGLVKLSRVTGNQDYLALAKFLLDVRGGSGEYWQAHEAPVKQTTAVGHAVRASYLYSGMADVATYTGDKDYVHAIDAIWKDVVDTKLYVTGGIGQTGSGEAFAGPYDLPNASAYCETCAAVGNDYWNERLFLLHADGKYIDVFERTLYNGLLSGVSLDGKGFFYPNPLASNGQNERSPWFGCACCPGNITRFMASVPGYFYATKGDTVWVNLFATGKAEVPLSKGKKFQIVQSTEYPWKGAIHLTINPAKATNGTVKVRIPGWARNQAVPSDLYRFEDSLKAQPTLKLNGKSVPVTVDKGYVTFTRTWKKGDSIDLDLPMPVRRVVADAKVGADQGRVALQRGPVVYCAEWKDNADVKIRNLVLPNSAEMTAVYKPNTLNGVTEITGTAETLRKGDAGQTVSTPHPFVAIPYYAWANRGRGEMAVWLPDSEQSARVVAAPTLTEMAKVTTSGGTGAVALNDGEYPRSVFEESSYFHWWPKKGTTEWVRYDLQAASKVSGASIYWFDDTGRGECRVPESWRVLYKDGDDWKPVEAESEYSVVKDKLIQVNFKPVTTTALKLEVKLQKGWSAGIYEWSVK